MQSKSKPIVPRLLIVALIYVLVTSAVFAISKAISTDAPLALRTTLAILLDITWCLPITIGRLAPSMPVWCFFLLVPVNALVAGFVVVSFVDVIAETRRPQEPADPPAD